MTLNAEKIHIKWKSGLQILSCLEENDLGMAVGKVNFSEKKKKRLGSGKQEGRRKFERKFSIAYLFVILHSSSPTKKTEIKKI